MTKGKKLAATILATLALSATVCAAPRSASEQIQIFAETANSGQEGGWFVSPEKDADWNRWFYAVTDLDRDGRLEIFKAKRGGEGIAPEIRCEEFNDSLRGIQRERRTDLGTLFRGRLRRPRHHDERVGGGAPCVL